MNKTRYLYKTTCLVTGCYYLGMHSTKHPSKPYYGSGIRLKRSLSKYGREQHSVEIIAYYESDAQLHQAEQDLITTDVLSDPLCLNLMEGGKGGFTDEMRDKALAAVRTKLAMDPEYRDHKSRINASNAKQKDSTSVAKSLAAIAEYKAAHSDEWKALMISNNQRSHEQRRLKLQQGWVWLTDPSNIRRRKLTAPEDIDQKLKEGWRIGRC